MTNYTRVIMCYTHTYTHIYLFLIHNIKYLFNFCCNCIWNIIELKLEEGKIIKFIKIDFIWMFVMILRDLMLCRFVNYLSTSLNCHWLVHIPHPYIFISIHKFQISVTNCLLWNFAGCSNALIIPNRCYCKERKQEIDRYVDSYYDTNYWYIILTKLKRFLFDI